MTVRSVALVLALAALLGAVAILWHGEKRQSASAPASPVPLAAETAESTVAGGATATNPNTGEARQAPQPSAVEPEAPAGKVAAQARQDAEQNGQPVPDFLERQRRLAEQIKGNIKIPDLPPINIPDLSDPNWYPPTPPQVPDQ